MSCHCSAELDCHLTMGVFRFTKLFVTAAIFLAQIDTCRASNSSQNQDRCIMYDASDDNNYSPFVYNGPPKLLKDDEALKNIKKLCPELYKGPDSTKTCCSPAQVANLNSQRMLMSVMFPCATCRHNFLQAFCQMICSPQQNKFLKLTSTAVEPYATKRKLVSTIDYYMSLNYIENVIRSCRSVHSTVGGYGLTIVCGTKTPNECTPKKLLTAAGGYSPFKFNMIFSEQPVDKNGTIYEPMWTKTIPCDGEYNNERCSKTSCKDTEPIPRPTPVPPPQTLRPVSGQTAQPIQTGQTRQPGQTGQPIQTGHTRQPGQTRQPIQTGHTRQPGQTPGVTMTTPAPAKDNSETSLNKFKNFIISMDTMEITAVTVMGVGLLLSAIFLVCSCRAQHISDKQLRVSRKEDMMRTIKTNDISCLEKLTAWVEELLRKFFCWWGTGVAMYPRMVLIAGFMICGALSAGMFYFKVTTDPVELWASPNSKARLDKNYFDTHFQPFYRTEQLIIKPVDQSNFTAMVNGMNMTFGPVFRQDFLESVLRLQNDIQGLTGNDFDNNITLTDICFRPLYPQFDDCTIQSILNYFQNDMQKLKQPNYLETLVTCMSGYMAKTECFGKYGGPIQPEIVLGGFTQKNYEFSKAMLITFVNDNNLDKFIVEKAKAWELKFIEYMKSYKNDKMSISYNSERSIEDELSRGSHGDVFTIMISYLIMFTYISLALGQPSSLRTLFIETKITLGLFGVLIVVVSVLSSIGLFSYMGVAATLIIIEVIPFLVLAIGVDNIFILVQALQRDEKRENESLEEQIGRVVGEVGPSMLLSSVSEAFCFFLGSMSNMPAVKIFAMYAGVALLIDFLLQITCFISLLALDTSRQMANRYDVVFCVKSKTRPAPWTSNGFLYRFFDKLYAPFLMNNVVRTIVMVVFLGWFCSSLAVVNKLDVGLNQELALPKDSYVVKYFADLKSYLSIGPPVYMVITDGYAYDTEKSQNALCTMPACDENSFGQKIYQAIEDSNRTKLQGAFYSWINNYIPFMRTPNCCLYHKNNRSFCPTSEGIISKGFVKKLSGKCERCGYHNSTKRPIGREFYEYLEYFTRQAPSDVCPMGGQANYRFYIETKPSDMEITFNDTGTEITVDYKGVGATMFMLYHTVLKTSEDYTAALKSAWDLADQLTAYLHKQDNNENPTYRVFAYSVFYVFYEQYLTTWYDTVRALVISMLTIFVVLVLLTGFDIHSSTLVILTIAMIITNLFGLMYWWSIALNAVALVNLIVAVGISVEFCSHITRSFSSSIHYKKVDRAKEALTQMGSSVLSGITLTKFGGIVVLAFAQSRIFQVYYFRLYLCIVLFGAAHGLIFLPVILSVIGPSLNRKKVLNKSKNNKQEFEMEKRESYIPQTEI